jgi:hypothetical protein
MSVRLGTIFENAPYEVHFAADAAARDTAFVVVGWIPVQGVIARSRTMRVEPGQDGNQADTAPAAASYYAVEIDVDVPDGGPGGRLTFSGGTAAPRSVPVTEDETYLVQIVRASP